MPKWIINTKRRYSRNNHEYQEKALYKGTSRGGTVVSGASLSSDSGGSISPVGSSESESEGLFQHLKRSPDWRDRRPSIGEQKQRSISPSAPEEDDDAPLDLSVNGPFGRGRTNALAGGESVIDEKVKLHRMKEEPEVPILVRIKSPLPLVSPLSQQKDFDTRRHLNPRNLRLISNSFSGKSETRKRHHASTENNSRREGQGQIPEAHATPEALALLERIENKIGDCNCMLCGNHYKDVFDLANHNCSCIVKVIHSCSECDKVFQCPANLASHRRWHGIRGSNLDQSLPGVPEAAATASPHSTSSSI